jgi:hypothetical protein
MFAGEAVDERHARLKRLFPHPQPDEAVADIGREVAVAGVRALRAD